MAVSSWNATRATDQLTLVPFSVLTQAKGNQNMIRCWGGGVYEPGAQGKGLTEVCICAHVKPSPRYLLRHLRRTWPYGLAGESASEGTKGVAH